MDFIIERLQNGAILSLVVSFLLVVIGSLFQHKHYGGGLSLSQSFGVMAAIFAILGIAGLVLRLVY